MRKRWLSAIEGSAGNLRGALFELIVGHCVRALEGGSVDIGLIVTSLDRAKRAEIDVRLIREKAVTIYECKGYQPSSIVHRPEVERWLTEKVPTIYSALKQEERFSSSKFVFEFWTCGSFDAEALEYLRNAKSVTRKYGISWKDGKAIQQYSQDLSSPGIKKILNEHYFNHPISAFNKDFQEPLAQPDLQQTLDAFQDYSPHL